MAREVSRTLDAARRAVIVQIEDDFGVVSSHTVYVTADKCPLCGLAMTDKGEGIADVNAQVEWLLGHISDVTGTVIERFAAAGLDVAQAVTRRQERLSGKDQTSTTVGVAQPNGATTDGASQG